eukprot:Gb_06774 [translate_table: standard]
MNMALVIVGNGVCEGCLGNAKWRYPFLHSPCRQANGTLRSQRICRMQQPLHFYFPSVSCLPFTEKGMEENKTLRIKLPVRTKATPENDQFSMPIPSAVQEKAIAGLIGLQSFKECVVNLCLALGLSANPVDMDFSYGISPCFCQL